MLRRLLAQSSVYTVGSLLTTAAGFISFPIFTRIFSVGEYGLLSLVNAMLIFLVGFAKLGMQHATVRFHGEGRVGALVVTPAQYFSTVIFGMTAMAAAIAAAWAVLTQVLPARLWNDPRLPGLLLLTAVLVLIRSTESAIVNILRAQERSVAFNVYAVAKRYGSLAAILATVYFVLPGLQGFYAGTIAMEALVLAVAWRYLRRTCDFDAASFSLPLYRAMLAFGIPMVAYELGGVGLALSDRFVIQHVLGPEPLGLYSAAYNVCEYVEAILIASIGQAILPIYVRLWRDQGEAATRRFVEESLHYYLLIGAAIVAGLAAVGPDLLVLLASEKYRAGAAVIPLVAAAMVLNGGSALFAAGLYIHKQTRVLVAIVGSCAALNIALNLLFVPRFGIVGAAACTLAAYVVLSALLLSVGRRGLRVDFPWIEAAKFSALAGLMYVVVSSVHVGGAAATLVARVALGVLCYAGLVLLFDGRSRLVVASMLRPPREAA